MLSYFIFICHFLHSFPHAMGYFFNFSFSVCRNLEALLQVLVVGWLCATCKCSYKCAVAIKLLQLHYHLEKDLVEFQLLIYFQKNPLLLFAEFQFDFPQLLIIQLLLF